MSTKLNFGRNFFAVIFWLLASSVALANIPGLQVNGNTISWTTTGYMQVQNAEDFETICEGNQFSCIVPPVRILLLTTAPV